MSNAVSDHLSVSSSEQNTTKSQLLSLKEKIDKTVQEYNKAGIPEIPKKLRKDLKDRLTLTWVSSTEGASSTQWRKERAHDVYLQVLNACPHLYVAFISIIAPTACFQPNIGRTVAKLLQLNKETPVRLKLNSEAKEFFRSIAVAGAFTEDPRFVKFICSLFPEDTPSSSKTTDRTNITPPNETQSELTAVSQISSNHPNFTTAQEQRVFGNASLQGIAKVFDEYMCGAIRRVTVDSDLKAAVTMVFPVWGGPVDCLMSLDVCERDVEQLVMALFNAKVKWAEHVLHVVLNEGITLVIPNSEGTLKGVPDVAIFKVFGPEIHDAITECPVRRRELAEGKRVTECVSVILTKNGAIINLSLGLERGLQIQNKLYT